MRDDSVNLRLRQLIHERGIKQKTLALRCGMKYQDLSRAVNGRRPIYAHELWPIASALGVSVNALLGLELVGAASSEEGTS